MAELLTTSTLLPPTILLMVPEKPRFFVLGKIQHFRWSLGLGTSLPTPDGQGWDLHCLLLVSSYRPTGHGTGLRPMLSVSSCVSLGQATSQRPCYPLIAYVE